MGSSVSRLASDYLPERLSEVYKKFGNKRKRKCSSDEDESSYEESLHSPKK